MNYTEKVKEALGSRADKIQDLKIIETDDGITVSFRARDFNYWPNDWEKAGFTLWKISVTNSVYTFDTPDGKASVVNAVFVSMDFV